MSDRKFFIYRLVRKERSLVFYVGITVNKYSRLSMHKKVHGADILLEEIEVCDNFKTALERENYWIGFYRTSGVLLLNKNTNKNIETSQMGGRKRISNPKEKIVSITVCCKNKNKQKAKKLCEDIIKKHKL